ncbi:MAG: hypothetical protein SVU88_02270 [Candidatus Nanohaloarchaea archaeon]|nr:hypothetical protein [Candidatus Nanohaloarchaea archaeon]
MARELAFTDDGPVPADQHQPERAVCPVCDGPCELQDLHPG